MITWAVRIVVGVGLAIALPACTGSGDATGGATDPESASEQPAEPTETTPASEDATPRADGPTEVLRLGHIPISDTLPVYVGLEEGYFAEEGVDLELVPNAGGAVGIPALAGGSLDLQYADVGTGINAMAEGVPLRIVAPAGTVSANPDDDTAAFLASTGSGIETLEDARGKRVGVNLRGNLVHLYTMAALDNVGVAPEEYEIVEIPYPQMVDTLLQGDVDMIYQVDPFVTILEQQPGQVVNLGPPSYDIHKNLQFAGYFTTGEILEEHGDAIAGFQRAYARAAEYVNDNPDMHATWQEEFFSADPNWSDQLFVPSFPPELGDYFAESLDTTVDYMREYDFLNGEPPAWDEVLLPR